MDLAALSKPFPGDRISWRVGSTTGDKKKGMALAYIDARDVMDRLDEAVGPNNWQDRYEFHGPRTVCYLSIRINDEWVTKADGAGDSDVESEKGSISDALKRAAVKWGIGRYLYDLDSPWVAITQRGKSYAIDPDEMRRLASIAGGAKGFAARPAPTEPTQPNIDAFELQLAQAAQRGVDALKAVWADLPREAKAELKPAMDERFKVIAQEADLRRQTLPVTVAG